MDRINQFFRCSNELDAFVWIEVDSFIRAIMRSEENACLMRIAACWNHKLVLMKIWMIQKMLDQYFSHGSCRYSVGFIIWIFELSLSLRYEAFFSGFEDEFQQHSSLGLWVIKKFGIVWFKIIWIDSSTGFHFCDYFFSCSKCRCVLTKSDAIEILSMQ